MTRDEFLKFVRAFRRPYASVLCSTTLCGSAIGAAFGAGPWMPVPLALVFASIIIGDGTARLIEKYTGTSDNV